MDAKGKALVSQLVYRVDAGMFDERDVSSLLMLLRPHSDPKSPVAELAHFIAHRERDRGAIRHYLISRRSAYERAIEKDEELPEERVVFTPRQIMGSINELLDALSLPTIGDDRRGALTFAIMSLLQDVRFPGDEPGREEGRLTIGFEGQNVVLYGMIKIMGRVRTAVSVLKTANDDYMTPLLSGSDDVLSILNAHIEVGFEGGRAVVRLL